MLRKILLASVVLLAAVACSKSGTDGPVDTHALLEKDAPGVYRNDDNVFLYDEDIHQIAFNALRRTFRIQNTAQDRYLHCALDADPVVGQQVAIDVTTRSIASFPSQQLTAEVLRRDEGKVWLWDEQSGTGLVIRIE